MAIIYSYPIITSLTNDDRLIISDMDSTTGNPTKSVTLSTLKSFISGTPGAGGVTGTGTTNKIPLWTNGPSGVIGDSLLQQDVGGTEVQLSGNLSMKANDLLDVNGETGTAGQILSSLGTGNGVDWVDATNDVPYVDGSSNRIARTEDVTNGNTSLGHNALQVIDAAGALYNTALGTEAGTDITTGDNNTSIGYRTLYTATTQNNNTAVGYLALTVCTSDNNVAVGSNAGLLLNSGSDNVIIGYDAGKALTSGQKHEALVI